MLFATLRTVYMQDSWTKLLHCICKISIVPCFLCFSFFPTLDSCIAVRIVLILYECDYNMYIICFSRIHVFSTIFSGHIFANMYKLSVIVIDKPIGLGGTAYSPGSIFVWHLCTIYHQNKRSENYINISFLCCAVGLCCLTTPGLSKDIRCHV